MLPVVVFWYPWTQITQNVWRNLLLNFVYSEEYDSDEDDALQSKSNFNIGFIPWWQSVIPNIHNILAASEMRDKGGM